MKRKAAWRRQAIDLNSVITSVRSYYASNVITKRAPGLELYLDPAVGKSGDAARVRSLLENALASLKPA